ncbi:MAG: DUF362 domain-containing protein [Bryobacterales bacterium]|nr:DUF362 domain-containing protein [Bryobacteraceae bacterium]MDW8129184.1 DUF362 domain-containing protein [Bryobacterales bacterium]
MAVVRTADRAKGVSEVFRLLEFPSPRGRDVLLKPNFNTADPAPGSTHNDTLRELVAQLRQRGARGITIGERSGPPPTRKVMEEKGIFDLARELDLRVINFEELQDADWVHLNPAGNHWQNGFWVPKVVAEADYVVSTCCLKTHGYGGVFTMALKLAVGMTPKRLMRELHGNREHMRRMIAEINLGYRPQLIVLDGVEAFVDGGPAQGKRVTANVFLGGTDRIAVDAVGLAMLKELGSNEAIMGRKIFEQEQIQRAVELGLGIRGPEQIELVASDPASQELANRLRERLLAG